MFLLVGLYGFLMQTLVQCWVICVHINLIVMELYAFLWLLVEYDIKFDFVVSTLSFFSKHWMLLHFLPCRPVQWIMLHCFIQEVKCVQTDRYITWPTPCSFFDLLVEQCHGICAFGRAIDTKHEHSCEHLVENDPDCPYIYLMTVAGAATPVGI